MDWQALRVSLSLGLFTVLVLLPFGLWLGHLLATRRLRGGKLSLSLFLSLSISLSLFLSLSLYLSLSHHQQPPYPL